MRVFFVSGEVDAGGVGEGAAEANDIPLHRALEADAPRTNLDASNKTAIKYAITVDHTGIQTKKRRQLGNNPCRNQRGDNW